MDVSVYEAQADTINVDDIATDYYNGIVMRRIQNNVADERHDSLWVQNRHEFDGIIGVDYVPEGTDDMGWLGYFVGKNEHLKNLFIRSFSPSGASVRDLLDPFFRGVNNNKSIREIDLKSMDLLRGEIFTMLTPFFQNNYNLTNINVSYCDFGDGGGRLFALAIGSSTHKSLQTLVLKNNSNISEEGMVNIITALSMHSHLQRLHFEGNRLHKNTCVALATLLRSSATELQRLFISRDEINDEGIEALVLALANCSCLKYLSFCDNPTITTRGWQSLASILESSSCNLTMLNISGNNVDDDAAAAFANALANNRTLHTLKMNTNPITAVGWEAFSIILCDTSSVNATFLSNHTLWNMGNEIDNNEIIGPILDLNARGVKKEVATIKILQSHSNLDMQPFFEWEFKVLPLVLGLLERASSFRIPRNFEPNIERRKLSTIYQFVRGMPVLYVETRLRKELEDIKAEQSQMEEKFEEEQRRLLQEFKQRKQYLQDRKESIMRNLRGNLLSTESGSSK